MKRLGLKTICIVIVAFLALAGIAQAATLLRDDFRGGNSGWMAGTGGGGNEIEWSNGGEYLYLHDTSMHSRFPLVGRNDAFNGVTPYWRMGMRFRYPQITGYGTTLAIGTANFELNWGGGVRNDWENVLRITQRSGPGNFLISAFGTVHYAGSNSTAWHVVELGVSGSSYQLLLDGAVIGSGTPNNTPRSLWFGNYASQTPAGWSDIMVDWVTVGSDQENPETTASLSGTPGSGGWWRSPVGVTLSSSDSWSGVAWTRYDLGGGSTPYGGPFTISNDGWHTLAYQSGDNAGNTEGIQSLSVNIDTLPPSTSATPAGTVGCAGWYTSTVQMPLSASDATSGVALTQYQVNGGGWQAYGGPFTLGDGSYTVDYRSADVAGNQETASSLSLDVDTSPPATTCSPDGTSGDNGWWRSSVEVSLAASDATSGLDGTQYRVDAGAWQAYASEFTISGEGAHTLRYYSTDVACNAEGVTPESVDIDTVAPTSTLASLSDDEWISGTVSIAGTASDATSGVALVGYSIDGGTSWQAASGTVNWTDTWDTTAVADGDYDVCTRGRDVAGNVESVSCIAAHVDNMAPASTASRAGTAGCNGWYQSAVDVSLSASDGSGIGVSSTEYRVDGGAWQAYSSSFTVSGQGAHTVNYRSTDGLGNVEAIQSLAVNIDSVDPSTSAAPTGSMGSGGWYVSNVDVTLSASDATSGVDVTRYRVNGGSWQTYSGLFTISTNGTNTVEYRSADNACNTESVNSLSVSIDTVAPNTLATPTGTACGAWYRSSVDVSLSASDATSGVDVTRYRVNGGGWQTYSEPFTISTDGANTVEYRSIDNAGNSEGIDSIALQIDTVAPATTASRNGTAGSSGWYVSDVDVSLSANDATSGVALTEYRLDGGAWTPYGGSFSVNTDGAHVVEYRSTDVACNPESVRSLSVNIDTVDPTTVLNLDGTAGNAGWWRSAVTATLAASDATSGIDSTEYILDAGGWSVYSAPFPISGEGDHDVDYRSTDVAGNVEAVAGASVRIDTVPPATTAAITGTLGINGWYTDTVTVSLLASDATSGVDATYLGGTAYTAPVTYTVDGRYAEPYYSRDVAGNPEAQRPADFGLDTTPPDVNVIGGRFCPRCGQTLLIQPNASDVTSGLSTWRLELLDGATVVISWTGTTSPASIPWNGRDESGNRVDDGTYDLRLWANDVAGWTAVATGQATVRPRPSSPPPPAPPPTATALPLATFTPWPTWTPAPTELPTATPTLRPGETPAPTLVPSPAPTETPTPTPAPVAEASPAVALRVGVFQDDDEDAIRGELEIGLVGLEVYAQGSDWWQSTYVSDAQGVVTITLPGPGVYEVSLLAKPREGRWAATTRQTMMIQVDVDRSVVILPADRDEALPVGVAPMCAFAFGLAPRIVRAVALWLPFAVIALLVLATLGAVLDRRARAIQKLEKVLGGAK